MTNKTYKISIVLEDHAADAINGEFELEFSWDEFETVEEAKDALIEWLKDLDHNDGGNFGEPDGEYIGSVWEVGKYDNTVVTTIRESEALKGTGLHLYAASSPSFIEAVAYCRAGSYEEAAEKIACNWEEADDFCEYIANDYGEISQTCNGEEIDCFHVEEI